MIRKSDSMPSLTPIRQAGGIKQSIVESSEVMGHTIEECRQLKVAIARPIRDGTLRRFARKDKEGKRLEHEVKALVNYDENEPLGVINVIAGGPSCNKGKNKCTLKDVLSIEKDLWASKRWTFRSSDRIIESPYNDPLVISVRLNMYEVKWVLAEMGSSVNLLIL